MKTLTQVILILVTVQSVTAQNPCNVFSSLDAVVLSADGDSIDFIYSGETKLLNLPEKFGVRTANVPGDVVQDCASLKKVEEIADSVVYWYIINTLPAEIVSLTGEVSEKITLRWQVASQQNVKEYEVEIGDVNQLFQPAYIVPANSSQEHYTAIFDNLYTDSVIYVRLKVKDFDGTFEYSGVITLSNPQRAIQGAVKYFSVNGVELREKPRTGIYFIQKGNTARKMGAIKYQ